MNGTLSIKLSLAILRRFCRFAVYFFIFLQFCQRVQQYFWPAVNCMVILSSSFLSKNTQTTLFKDQFGRENRVFKWVLSLCNASYMHKIKKIKKNKKKQECTHP